MRRLPQRAFVALGSNLGERGAHLRGALEALRATPGVRVLHATDPIETEPVGGPPGQRRFLNAVVELAADGDPDTATARVWMCELRTDAATGEWNNAFGVYHDRYRRTDDTWRFAHRRYHSLARTADGPHRAEAFAFPHGVDLGT